MIKPYITVEFLQTYYGINLGSPIEKSRSTLYNWTQTAIFKASIRINMLTENYIEKVKFANLTAEQQDAVQLACGELFMYWRQAGDGLFKVGASISIGGSSISSGGTEEPDYIIREVTKILKAVGLMNDFKYIAPLAETEQTTATPGDCNKYWVLSQYINKLNFTSNDGSITLKLTQNENGLPKLDFKGEGIKTVKYRWYDDTPNWELQDEGIVVFWKKPDDLAIKMFVSLSTKDRVILSFELPLNVPQNSPLGKWVIAYNGVGVKVSWIDFQYSIELLDKDDNPFKVAFINEVFILTAEGIPLVGNMNPANFTYKEEEKYWDFSEKVDQEIAKIGNATSIVGIEVDQNDKKKDKKAKKKVK